VVQSRRVRMQPSTYSVEVKERGLSLRFVGLAQNMMCSSSMIN
jgi:hypothetical protein